jgi:hypothetical protein
MYLPRLAATILLILSGTVAAQDGKVRDTYNLIVANAKARSPAYQEVNRLFPSTFVAADYEAIARQLMLDGLDLAELSDEGLTYKWSAVHAAFYKLSEVPKGDASLMRILEDERLPLDAGESLTLCDAILRRGREMLPLLAKVSKRRNLAQLCSRLIAEGRSTAF